MLFVTFAKARGNATPRERIARRLEYHFPEGCHVLAEYWPMSGGDPAVVLITEADDIGPVMAAVGDWSDVFDVSVFPAVTAAEGMQLAKERLATAVLPLATEQPAELAVR